MNGWTNRTRLDCLSTRLAFAPMAVEFEWNRHGKRWDARKVRRKRARYEHKGIAQYDRERMKQPLLPIVHPNGFDGYSAPPSWAEVPESWGKWEHPLPAGYFHQNGVPSSPPVDDLDAPLLAQTAEYTLKRCHVETCRRYRNPLRWQSGQPSFIARPVTYLWELMFADGTRFRFVSRAIAEIAVSELLKIRAAKHPCPEFVDRSPKTFFTARKLAKLPADAVAPKQVITPTDAVV